MHNFRFLNRISASSKISYNGEAVILSMGRYGHTRGDQSPVIRGLVCYRQREVMPWTFIGLKWTHYQIYERISFDN